MSYLLVALGAAFGAAARYLLGTFVVNITGAFLVGIAFSLSGGWPITTGGWQLVSIGVLGGYTTFSTFSQDTLELLAGRKYGLVFLNLLTGPAGLIAVFLGVLVGQSLLQSGGVLRF
jgi:CrcB protein